MKFHQIIFTILLLSILVTGCQNSDDVLDNAERFISTLEEADIPDDVKVIGLGEATHGNVEFQQLKKEAFEVLMEKEQVQVFVLEGDFGGAQRINDFILEGKGTAKEAVYALDYDIYKTEQMIDLVEWLHDYNESVEENEKVYFYGNDMQRYDESKLRLLDYYETVNKDAAEEYSAQLRDISNDTMHDLTTDQQQEIDNVLDYIIEDLKENKSNYMERTTNESYAFALQYAKVMKQRTDLLMNEKQYAQLRDSYLTENLEWIVDFEAERGHDKVFISAHNGHIEKTSASFGYKSMGDYLDEIYGDAYFAIGTDFIHNTLQAKNQSNGKRKDYSIKSRSLFAQAFSEVDNNRFYVDFNQASESQKLLDIISTEQKMPNIGDDFRIWYKISKSFYTVKMIPIKAYDGMFIFKEVTPTTVMEQ